MPYINGKIDLKGYITGAELVNSLITQCSWFIQVMPAIATLNADAKRVTEITEAMGRVKRDRDFYRLTGCSDFRYGVQHAVFGLAIPGLKLMHQGDDPCPL